MGAERVWGKGKDMKIGDRDREILRISYEQQMISTQLMTRYFFGGHDTHARRRLRELAEGGYLREAEVRGGWYPHKLYRPTTQGAKLAGSLSRLVIPQRRVFSLSTLEHELLVTDVRLRLSQVWDAAWLPRKALRADNYRQVADGLLAFPSGRVIAVEVEAFCRTELQYQHIWQKWVGTNTFLVLYVAKSPVVAALLRRLLVLAPKGAAFGVVEWEALRRQNTAPPLIWTPRAEVDLFSKRSI